MVSAAAMIYAIATRELERPEGVLAGDQLFGVRAPSEELRLTDLIQSDEVQEDGIVARLTSPGREAKVRELQLRLQRLESERETLRLVPPELDNNLIRGYQNALSRCSQLRASIDVLLPAHQSAVRQVALERMSRLEETTRLDAEVNASRGAWTKAVIRRDYAKRQLGHAVELATKSAISDTELDSHREQVEELDAEIDCLEQQIDRLAAQKGQIAESLQQLEKLLLTQGPNLQQELDEARTDFAEAEPERQRMEEDLNRDLVRARNVHARRIEQITLEMQECRAELDGVQETLVVRAPYTGKVVYRDLSPGSAAEKQPVLVLSRQSGFCLRMRLPGAQLAALQNAGDVPLQVVDSVVEPYFYGRYLRSSALAHKPKYVVAELSCQPPQEVIKDLVDGEKIVSQLLWRPPLSTLLPFRAGLLGLLVGSLAWALTCRIRRSSQRPSPRNARPSPVESDVSTKSANLVWLGSRIRVSQLETGELAGMLELLGAQMGEALRRVDRDG
ncbi:MAG: hypothetical protein JJ992_14420, partial [Planctomycetes bacterium]|nr:hypothetical protein [Planctomycetota bacterium]